MSGLPSHNPPELPTRENEPFLYVIEGSQEHRDDIFDPTELGNHSVDSHFHQLLPERGNVHEPWPSYADRLEFSHASMVGSEWKQATPDTRMRTIVLAAEKVAPDSLNKHPRATIEESHKYAMKFLQGEVKVQGSPLRRDILLPSTAVVSRLYMLMELVNHPIHQSMELAKTQYPHVMNESEWAELKHRVILSSQHHLVEDIYKLYILNFHKIVGK